MKKSTQKKVTKVKKGAIRAAHTARIVTANAFLMGRGIVSGVKQGISDIQRLNTRSKRKS